DWILILPAKKTEGVGVLQFFQARWITSEFFYITPNCPRVLHSAVDEFFFTVAPDLKSHCGDDSRRGNGEQSHNQHPHQQHVAALRARSRAARKSEVTQHRCQTLLECASLPQRGQGI